MSFRQLLVALVGGSGANSTYPKTDLSVSMLARWYLNARRAVLSSFTLISLIGVMVGVLVLVVVMAVYAGLERDVKGRLLGFTPHVSVKSMELTLSEEELDPDVPTWHDLAAAAAKIERVAAATAYVADGIPGRVGAGEQDFRVGMGAIWKKRSKIPD